MDVEIKNEDIQQAQDLAISEIIKNKGELPTFVEPHTKVSRAVTELDIERVLEDAKKMQLLCSIPVGYYQSGLAVAHSQVTSEDPLRFFVTVSGYIIVNPTIVKHTNVAVPKREGCLSFPYKPEIMVKRFHKCEVAFYTIAGDKTLTDRIMGKCKGKEAAMFQHEIDHMDGKYLYEVKTAI